MDRLGTSFSDEEWKVITGKEAWQNGTRLPQVLHLLKYLEDRIAKQFDLFDSVLCSGLLGDCSLRRWAAKKKSVFAWCIRLRPPVHHQTGTRHKAAVFPQPSEA